MRRQRPDIAALEERIGHRFAAPDLLAQALTHTSVGSGADSYQRLEFLGDRVLGLAVAESLLRADPAASEGDLSRRLAALVRWENCAAVAQGWDVAPHMRLDKSMALSGGRRNAAVMADVCEAILGAVFLDGGYEAARAVIAAAFATPLVIAAVGERGRDAKTALQEWAQGRGLPTPLYEVIGQEGPDHAPSFRIVVRVEGVEPGVGTGTSKRTAQQDAARALLVREGLWQVEEVRADA